MNWKPSTDIDEKIRGWMRAKGWEVTATDYNFEREVYAWRHELQSGDSPTVRITRFVLEHYPAFAIIELLNRLQLANAVRSQPGVRLVVVQNGQAVHLVEDIAGE